MTDRLDDLPDVAALARREPPPGGLARLRTRLDREATRSRAWRVAMPLALAAAVVAVLLLARGGAQRGVVPLAPTASAQVAAPVRDAAMGSGFYWVASVARAPTPRPTALPVIDAVGVAPVALRP